MLNPPDRPTLRKMIAAVLPLDSDFHALCIDRFPETNRRIGSGMNRDEKVNLLLEVENPEEIVRALQAQDPARYAKHIQSIGLPLRAVETRMASQPLSPSKPVTHSGGPTMTSTNGGQEPGGLPTLAAIRADVVIVTALKEEYDEARKVDDGAVDDWTEDPELIDREVAFRTYQTASGQPLRVALTWATRMRATTAADTAGRLLDKLGAKCVAMCGVCAGRRGRVQPGDVIIGDLLYTYDAGSTQIEYDEDGTKHERFQSDPDPVPLNDAWRHRAQAFKPPSNATWILNRPATLAAQGDWILSRLHASDDPQTHAESKQRCPAWKEALHRLQELGYVTISKQAKVSLRREGKAYISRVLLEHRGTLPEPPPWKLHIAPIATGGNVMRDPKLFERLSSSMRKVLGVEMEAAAIASVAHARSLPWLVMKGVMDHADHDKDDLLKSFAARASAECLILFLRQNPPGGRPRAAGPGTVAGSTVTTIPKGSGAASAPQASTAPSAPGPRGAKPVSSEELAELKKKLEAVLRRHDPLVKALGKYASPAKAGCDPVKAIAAALTSLSARDVVSDLNTLTQQDAGLQSAVRELLVHVLPLAVDWQEMVAHAEAAKRPDALELPLRTMTLAEVINARLDNRSCLFAPGDGDLQGVAHVPLPSVVDAPFFDLDGQGMADALTSNLWQAEQTSGTPLPGQGAWGQLKKSAANPREFGAAVETEINKPNRKLNRYLLFMDAKLVEAGMDEADLDASWSITHHALKQTLPGLRLVRLKGRDAEWKQEYGLVSDIRDLHNP